MNYIIVFALRGSESENSRSEIVEELKKLLTSLKGEVESVEEMGKKLLAHEIGKETEGYYYSLKFSSQTENLPAIHGKLRLVNRILRYILARDNFATIETKTVVKEETPVETGEKVKSKVRKQ